MLLVAVVCLALLNFFSTTPVLAWLLAKDEAMVPSEWRSAYWVGCRVLCYFLLPAIAAAALGRSPRDCGLRFRGVSRHLPAYLSLGGLMLPIVVSVSYLPAFQRYYPFYDHAEQSVQGLLLWEALYAVQFITLEYFYRGFLLFSLERFLGVYAVFVMVIPYCMMHFGKPFVETLAAIPAGIVLGILALKTRSIWPGAALHIAVGWTTDLLSLWQRGLLWELWSGD
jgi:membrane protease YdiL (CAAX protease family)